MRSKLMHHSTAVLPYCDALHALAAPYPSAATFAQVANVAERQQNSKAGGREHATSRSRANAGSKKPPKGIDARRTARCELTINRLSECSDATMTP